MSKELLLEYFNLYYERNEISDGNSNEEKWISPRAVVNHLNSVAASTDSYLSTPARVQWEITRRCQLRCVHCYIASEQPQQTDDELSTTECLALVAQCRQLGVLELEIQGGDPFCRKDLLEIVAEAYRLGVPYSILTNGIGITSELALNLKKYCEPRLNRIQISIDGPNPNINDAIRSKGAFQGIIHGLQNCRDAGLPYSANLTLCDLNVPYLTETWDVVAEVGGASMFTFATLMNIGRGKSINFHDTEEGLRQAIRLKRQSLQKPGPPVAGQVGYIMHVPGYLEAFTEYFGEEAHAAGQTHLARSSLDIDANGDCYPAAYLQVPEFKAGNFREMSLREMWDTPRWDLIRKSWSLPKKGCSDCEIARYCNKGSPAATYRAHSRFDARDPHCRFRSAIKNK